MLDVRAAANIAKENLITISEQEFEDLRIEEVELSEDENAWLITFGYEVSAFERIRNYRTIKIDANDGRFISMKMRKMQ